MTTEPTPAEDHIITINNLCVCVCVYIQVQAADSVLVIGGGSTGVEMAAEIRTEYPEKKVTCHYGNH